MFGLFDYINNTILQYNLCLWLLTWTFWALPSLGQEESVCQVWWLSV